MSSDLLSKVTHDLSNMLKNIHDYHKKNKNLNLKLPKRAYAPPHVANKNLKHKL